MAKCWRCGRGKTITMTTTGTHMLPCPTCGGLGIRPWHRKTRGTRLQICSLLKWKRWRQQNFPPTVYHGRVQSDLAARLLAAPIIVRASGPRLDHYSPGGDQSGPGGFQKEAVQHTFIVPAPTMSSALRSTENERTL